jgi:hypothetical protein
MVADADADAAGARARARRRLDLRRDDLHRPGAVAHLRADGAERLPHFCAPSPASLTISTMLSLIRVGLASLVPAFGSPSIVALLCPAFLAMSVWLP